MIYKWKRGAHAYGLSAQAVGERLEGLRARDGFLTAHTVIQDAVPKRSLLHPVFEWDDALAAEQWRLEQARALIRGVVVTYEQQPEQAPIRAFVVVVDEDGEQAYTSTYLALSDETLRRQVLERALHELQQWEERYQALEELAEVFAATRRVREKEVGSGLGRHGVAR